MTNQVTLAGTKVGPPAHACALFADEEEEYRVLLPFLQEGLGRGERSFHIADRRRHEEHRTRLETTVERRAAEERSQLAVKGWEEAYLIDGCFDQDRMLALIQEVLRDGRRQGFPMTRLWANMEWSLEENCPGVEQLVEYESRLNDVLPQYPDVVVCTYQLNRFSAKVVMDVLRIHPLAIVGGILHHNPFYVTPREFKQELMARSRSHM